MPSPPHFEQGCARRPPQSGHASCFAPPHTGHGDTLIFVSFRTVLREPLLERKPFDRKPLPERIPFEELPVFLTDDSVVVFTTAQPPLQSLFVHFTSPFPLHFLQGSSPVQLHFLQGCPNASSTSFSRSLPSSAYFAFGTNASPTAISPRPWCSAANAARSADTCRASADGFMNDCILHLPLQRGHCFLVFFAGPIRPFAWP